jgi:uncharacterized membrane-anchored protein YhcB (DUF1043 family)
MEILYAIGILVAAAAGFIFGKKNSSNEVEKQRIQQELDNKSAELKTFHSKVNGHFEKTSELFNHVSDSYQSLYDHMAKSSSQLCANQTFQSLPKSNNQDASSKLESEVNPALKQQAKDGELFDADHLYNAHDYRNKESIEEPIKSEEIDNKVVEITSAKDDANAQALDYAIKEKGVINHNSLDAEGVKNS